MEEVKVMQKQALRSLLSTVLALMLMFLTVAVVHAAGYEDYSSSDSPEYLYYIEGTGSYFLPGSDSDIFFNLGKWYRRSGGSWSISEDLGGPWSGITVDSVPQDLIELPEDFTTTRKLGMIPYQYVLGPDKPDDDHVYRYYRGRYDEDYRRRGYRRRWNPRGKFWFFVAPDFNDDD